MPDVEGDVALLDDLMDSLLEAGIEVIPGPAKPVQKRPPMRMSERGKAPFRYLACGR